MKVVSKLHRNGGTHIHFGSGKDRRTYHFKPLDPKADDNDDRVEHVAEVENKEDLAKLLAIPEGFELHDSEMGKAPPKAKQPEPEQKTDAAGAAGSGDSQSAQPQQKQETPYDKMTRKELLAAVERKTGNKPNPSTSSKKLVETLMGG